MTEDEVHEAILRELGGVDVVVGNGDSFYFFDPRDGRPVDKRFPFATLVENDLHVDGTFVSVPGVFRLSTGVSGETFRSLFPDAAPAEAVDPLTRDRLMPHPVYGRQHWVTVLNPSEESFERFRPLLAEAYAIAARQYELRPPPKR